MNDGKVIDINAGKPEPSQVERISGLMTTYTKEIIAKFAKAGGQVDPVALMAMVQIQGLQLEEFMGLVFSGEAITPDAFNARMEARTRHEIGRMRNMVLLARAVQVPEPPAP